RRITRRHGNSVTLLLLRSMALAPSLRPLCPLCPLWFIRNPGCKGGDLAVGEADALGLAQQRGREGMRGQTLLQPYDVAQLRQDPEVNACLFVQRLQRAIRRVAAQGVQQLPEPCVVGLEASILGAFVCFV